jgi:pSer/pThr/pTyr-binding forkhead associated (FHA) protein
LKALIDAEREGVPFLVWHTSTGEQQILRLDEGLWRLTIGRRPDADIPLVWDSEVSRTHALLELVGDRWTLVDDGLSSNGSFVNGTRVLSRHRLNDGERMVFGSAVVIFRQPSAGDVDPTVRVPKRQTAVALSDIQRKVLIALCRPLNETAFAIPATNKQIADELFLSVDAVKAHLRVLFDRFELGELPQNEKRAKLAATALLTGLLAPRDF